MEKRERIIQSWFDMWILGTDQGIETLFAPDAVYTECWGPEYHGSGEIKRWFNDWNTRGRVLRWEIRQFFHQGPQTAVEWYFKSCIAGEAPEAFEGMSLIQWTPDDKIQSLQEFGCKELRYDPYQTAGPRQGL
ncbi:MAG: nuclear transport factor 2 family protein [Clostridiales bacterium]|nr:nuclear transport factor 2 family protein [Clostridiales bacterium]